MLQHLVRHLLDVLPGPVKPLLFAPCLVMGREQAALVSNGVGWSQTQAVLAATIVYIIYVPLAAWLGRKVVDYVRQIWLGRFIRLIADRLRRLRGKSHRPGEQSLRQRLLNGPLWWQWSKVAAFGLVPTVGFTAGIIAAEAGGQNRRVLQTAVVAGGTISFLCYNLVIGQVMSLPLTALIGVVAVVIGLHHFRSQLAVCGHMLQRQLGLAGSHLLR
jgi:hypothetical protein